jgi:hypothetical protein
MADIKIKKGDKIFCVHRKAVDGGETPGVPISGTIIGITARANRHIAVELDEPVPFAHDCEGRGKAGHCIWCRPWHILTPAEWEAKKKQLEEAAKKAAETTKEVDELVLRNVG